MTSTCAGACPSSWLSPWRSASHWSRAIRRASSSPFSCAMPRRLTCYWHGAGPDPRAHPDPPPTAASLNDTMRASPRSLPCQEPTMTDHLIIFDTTLRDGEQSPGASMTREEKLRIARQLERMRVDVIEAGFAAASDGDFESVHAIAQAVRESTICSLARANENDIRRAGEAIAPAARGRIHTFIATSPIHMEMKLRMTPDQVVEQAVKAVKIAGEYTDNVEFSAEDAVRSDLDFLVRIFDAVIKAGAKTINVPDTVGYSLPALWGERMKQLIERVSGSDKVIWSTHCHNDLGMAVANSLAAVMNGARQVECTINGLGERAGNASQRQLAVVLRA